MSMHRLNGKSEGPGALLGWALTAGLVAMLALMLAGCLEADTRGGEAPDEVVFTGTPTWNNGVGQLMRLKCGVCHQVPPGALSPDAVPQDLDLNVQTTPAPGIRGAADILAIIAQGILRGPIPGVRQMPLDYATPLTAGEIAALEAWDGS